MSKIQWNEASQRFYETGIDRGVLFVEGGTGVPWNGLTGVTENPMGDSGVAYYQNAVKFNEDSGNDDFQATITAINFPKEFQRCDGTADLGGGLYIDRQERKRFHMSYRTAIGNDIDGPEHAYKLHLVYNALASPTSKPYTSRSETVDPTVFSWGIKTLPIDVPGYAPSAHFVIDSREVNRFLLAEFESIIYGTGSTNPRMPSFAEIQELFRKWVTLIITDNGDGTFVAEGPEEVVYMVTDTEFVIDWPSAIYIDADSYTVSTL